MKHEKTVNHAAFSPDGRRVVTASDDQTARVWDAATGQPIAPPMKHENDLNHAAFSPDGRHVVTASADNTARVWDATTGKPISPSLMKHEDRVVDAAFSPDGRRVITAQCGRHGAGLGRRHRTGLLTADEARGLGIDAPRSAPTGDASSPPAGTTRRRSGMPPPAKPITLPPW